ncbi:colanic acid biosynthesis glycosyltransferase WcaL (plasmid) [Neorhizobium sp. SOG26]|uniref:Glycosyltransferase family 4 protein n=1 Tax=Neorhizobium turbinariae TaxID=2937795 RepID=A0ABT0IX36_9HYPH|nr:MULTISPECIES: exopolysaccharide biosynthesis GT4 family glycosyltransferase EpsE [Neorhizobium]AXV18452.1 colanic acid biosynthesis glycosyltransferase WcaL [Neorhizobium sp. SOG26]MCK8782456.1 glycosyltransferase family 4 protein [Neorhizobium turbinariae]
MPKRIGFLIPEFPGQTHIFLWREHNALRELDVEAEFVSTSRPPTAISSHAWADEARNATAYLLPINVSDAFLALWDIALAGPARLVKALTAVVGAEARFPLGHLRMLGILLVAGKLIRLARRHKWSHIHVHSCGDAANVAMFGSLLSDIPYSLTLHGPTLEGYGPNQPLKWKHAAFATVISGRLYSDVAMRLRGSVPKEISVAPMGVDLSQIQRNHPYTPWKPGQPCRIFTCGRLNPVKGHDILLQTVDILRKRGIDTRLQIAGEDEQGGSGYRKDLEELIAVKGLGESVELLGAVSETRVRQALEEAHVFALASLNEGISVAIMEAMAMEMPVVVTDVGGNNELIHHRMDAILVRPERPNEMADAIEDVLYNRELAERLRAASRAKISARFHHRISAQALASLLTRCQPAAHLHRKG